MTPPTNVLLLSPPGAQRIATAWQAVPLRQPPSPSPSPACFALGDAPYALYAAGGSHPDVLHRWDLLSEKCTHQVRGERCHPGDTSDDCMHSGLCTVCRPCCMTLCASGWCV